MNAYKCYVLGFFLLIALAALSVLGLVVLVDSHGIYKIVSIEKINKIKVISNSLGRFSVGANLYLHDYDTVLVGTSRVQSGMDPRMDVLQGERVLNASLGDTEMNELVYLLDYILVQQPELKKIYVGLDFHAFSAYRERHEEFESALINPNNGFYSTVAKEIFSKRGVGDSLRTLKANIKGRPQRYWYEGHYHSEALIDYKVNIENIINYYMSQKVMFGCFDYDKQKYQSLADVLSRYAKAGIELNLFISPQHAKNLMILEYAGLFKQYYDWLRDMNAMAVNLQQQNDAQVRLWNFSGFNFITSEPVSYDFTEMAYFYETSHYKDNVGEMVVQVLNKEEAIQDFGQVMNDKTVEQVIASIDKGRKAYASAEPVAMQNLQRLYLNTAGHRDTLTCHLNN